MSTSLAEQLQRLALPQTTQLQRDDRKRASLLFDAKDAANLSREAVFQIGLSGFEELRLKSSIFEPFERTLFSLGSKDFQRAVQTAEANSSLNKNIKKYFLALAPYVLMTAAQRTLEWLIYRYQIHEYNKDDFIMLILPYHETNIFVRALQIVPIKDNDKWLWLKPLQKPGIQLSKAVLFNQAESNLGFLKMVSKLSCDAATLHNNPKDLTIIFNFYCVTFVGALESAQEVTENLITQMMPSILKALKSDIENFCAAAFIILSHIFTKISLTASVLDKLVKRIARVDLNFSTRSEVVMLLCILYQHNEEYNEMSDNSVKIISSKQWMVHSIWELSEVGYNLKPLLKPLLKALIGWILQEAEEKPLNFFDALFQKLKFDDEMVAFIIRITLNLHDVSTEYSLETKNWLKQFMQTVERQYPETFDREIKEIMKNNDKQQESLQKIMKHMEFKNRLEVLEKLYHPSADIRAQGIKGLIKNFDVLTDRDKEFVHHIVVDRLFEDDLEIVEQVITFSDKMHKANVVSDSDLKNALVKLMYKFQFQPISTKIIEKLCKMDEDVDYVTLFAIFPYFFPVGEDDFLRAKFLVNNYLKKFDIFNNFSNSIELNSKEDFANSVYKNLNKILIDRSKLLEAVKTINFDEYPVYKYIILLLLTKSGIEIDFFDNMPMIVKLVKSSELSTSETSISEYFASARESKLAISSVADCFNSLIIRSKKLELSQYDFYGNTQSDQNCLALFVYLLEGAFHKSPDHYSHFAALIKQFLTRFASNNKLEFMLNVASAENPLIEISTRIRLIRTVKELVKVKHDLNDNLNLACILTNLQHSEAAVRIVTIDLVNKLIECKCSHANILKELHESKLEIINDGAQVTVALSSCKDNLFDNLAEMCTQQNVPVYLKLGIINALSLRDNYKLYEQFSKLAVDILKSKNEKPLEGEIIKSIIAQFTETIVSELKAPVLSFVKLALEDDVTSIDQSCPSVLLMKKITRDLYDSLNDDIKKTLLTDIVDVIAKTSNSNILPAASKIFKHIDLDSLTVLSILEKMRDVLSPKLDESRRKRRISVVPTVDILETKEWKMGVALLELIQSKKKVRNVNALIPILFGILKKCLDFDEQASVEYPKQLALSSILHYCDKLDETPLKDNVFNVELIVQCIRASPNPQTHHHALLLLSKIATFIPDQVLLHIMAIFTFMGSSVLRHDDAYSFQIIAKIIETIVPILVQDNSRVKIVGVLRVFVDVILDVPEHRRFPLYTKLLRQIGEENLHLFLLLIFEAHVLSTNKSEKNENKRLDIACQLSQHFEPKDIISCCIQIVDYLKILPEDTESAKNVNPLILIDINKCTPKQFRHYKYSIVWFISKVLSSQELVVKVVALSKDEHEMLEDYYKKLIVAVLTYIQATARIMEKHAKTNQAQYWKVFLHHCYDILDSLNSLLTPEMFVLVIKGLTAHELPNIKRRALELLNSKMQHNPEFFNDCEENDLHSLIPSVILIIKKVEEEDLDTDVEVIIQTALLSLKLFIRMLAAQQPEKFVPILNFIVDLMKTKVHPNILASSILCLAEICVHLRSHSIAALNKFMPILLKVLKSQKKEDKPTLLLISAITALLKILDVLALFISPYLEKLLCEYSQLIAKFQTSDENAKQTESVLAKLNGIKEKLGTTVPARILIPAIDTTYKTLISKESYDGVGPLMNILSESLSHLSGGEVQQNIPELTSLFLNALEFRCGRPIDLANQNEGHVIDALTKLILKLSEASFRPLYYKLYDWAIRSDEKNEKVITFYALSHSIAASLKGLFVLFAGHFLNNAALILESCNSTKNETLYFAESPENSELLLENCLKALNFVFMHDYQKFINKERFDMLMQPIVDQLDNTLGDDYPKRVRELVIPVIVNFTVAIGDDALWKQMNYQVMLKMRDSNPTIRLLALECLRDICKKVGEDFLPLLPETIPFLSELLEDEEESIEKACQKTIQELEGVLGESLQKYF